jgi:signal transduction histidine kinase
MVERFGRQSGVVVHFITETAFIHPSAAVRRELVRILHEALVNVRKHSHASEALVWLRVDSRRLLLSVEDDGRGFEFEGRLTMQDLATRHEGPVVIRERVASLGGDLSVESRPGHGARLEVSIPLPSAASRAPAWQ